MRIILTTSLKPNPIDSPLVLSPNMMPLGLGFIAAVLEQKGHQVIIVDNYLCGTSLVGRYYHIQRFKGILRKFNPDFVGIYTYSVGFHKVLELIRLIKGFCSAKIICGGPHASEMPESFPAEVDFVVRGEGEFAVLDIVEGRVTERIIKVKRIDNLDELPMPAWHLFEHKRYKLREPMYLPHAPVFNLNTSRGCPFGCKFCSVPDVWGSEYRMFSAARIIQDIEYLINKYKIKGVYFREDNFTASRNRIMEFCNLLIDKKISIEWACETRVDTVDADMMEKMKQTGCKGFYVGVESGSQRVLDNINKGITIEQIKSFFSRCKALKIRTFATLCFGTPGETEDDRQLTERLIEEIKPDNVGRAVYVGVPKSKFYNYLLQTKQYYHIDKNGFLYPNGYRELAFRYYGRNARRYIP